MVTTRSNTTKEVGQGEVDLNNIAYDAPLTMKPPSSWWVRSKTRAGENSKFVKLPDADLQGKWIIITGSNNGIGREAALQMATWGANLVLGCRDPPPHELHPAVVVAECQNNAKAAGHEKSEIEYWNLDMANIASIEAFGQKWLDTGRPLDILCNNAGMGSSPGGNKVFRTKDGFEIIHQVNLLSHVLLTLTLLPSIKKAKEPRIVCTTSCFHYPGVFDLNNFNGELGKTGMQGVQYYMNNKLWFQVWLTELQRRLLEHEDLKHITVNGVHPGYVNSGIWNMNFKGATWQESLLKFLAWMKAINPQQGSQAILHGATSLTAGPDPKVQGVGREGGKGGGRYFNRIWEDEPMPHTKDQDCRLRVWRKVNDELKLQERGLLDQLGLYL